MTDLRREAFQKLEAWKLLEEYLTKGEHRVRGADRIGNKRGGHAVDLLRNTLSRALGDGISANPKGIRCDGWLSDKSTNAEVTVGLDKEAYERLVENYRAVMVPSGEEPVADEPPRGVHRKDRVVEEETVLTKPQRPAQVEYTPRLSEGTPDVLYLAREEAAFVEAVAAVASAERVLTQLGMDAARLAEYLKPGLSEKEKLLMLYPAAKGELEKLSKELSTTFNKARSSEERFEKEHAVVEDQIARFPPPPLNPFTYYMEYLPKKKELEARDRSLHAGYRDELDAYTSRVKELFDSVKKQYRRVREADRVAATLRPGTVPVFCVEVEGDNFYVSVPDTKGPVSQAIVSAVDAAVSRVAPEAKREAAGVHVTYEIIGQSLDLVALEMELSASQALAQLRGLGLDVKVVQKVVER